MQCAICEKPLFGHPAPTTEDPVVCGSCTLTGIEVPGGKPKKTMFEARLNLAHSLNKTVPAPRELVMAEFVIQSNYARNRVILLGGRHSLTFNLEGIARCPTAWMADLEREMAAKPGRYWVVTPEVLVPVQAAPPALPIMEVAEVAEKEVVPAEPERAVPSQIDISFLEGDVPEKKSVAKNKNRK